MLVGSMGRSGWACVVLAARTEGWPRTPGAGGAAAGTAAAGSAGGGGRQRAANLPTAAVARATREGIEGVAIPTARSCTASYSRRPTRALFL